MLRYTRTHIFTFLALVLIGYAIQAQSTVSGSDSSASKTKEPETSTENNPPLLGTIFKPTLGLGVGNLSFYGDLYIKNFQPPMVSRFAYELNLSQPLTNCLHLNFYVMFGKLGANERTANRNENFESTIRLGGVQLLYDFSNFIKKQKLIRPYILTGFEGFEFLTKTDLKDRFGNTYYYWNDGSIKNMAEGSANSATAVNLVRDYTYDSDVRELNRDGFGKYQERSWAIPVGAGFIMNIGDRVNFRFGATMHFAFTDYIDGVTSKSVGTRKGNSANDNFMMMSASLHYDLVVEKKDKEFENIQSDHFDNVDWMAIDKGDEDADGVLDFDDFCHGTPAGVKVDAKGCGLDGDMDWIPDHRDDELPTPTGKLANTRGVGITDPMAQEWYDLFYDTTGGMRFAKIINLDTVGKNKIDPLRQGKIFTVELARYKNGVPSDEMAYLLSIGDVKSFILGDETVIYAAGEYKDVRVAVQRKNEFVEEGLKGARVGYFKGENYFSLSDDDLKQEIAAAEKKFGTGSISTNTHKDQVIYRVQLGAYKNKLSPGLFKNVGEIIEVKTDDGYYRYATGILLTFDAAAFHKAELVIEGYGDAFITAYKNGKRITLKEAGTTFENKDDKEDINAKNNAGGAIDKSLLSFKIQISGLKKANDAAFEEQIKTLKDVSKRAAGKDLILYTVGDYKDYNDAVKFKATLIQQGFAGAFVIAMFKGEVISIPEALEILFQ